jgi:hypothetical protein
LISVQALPAHKRVIRCVNTRSSDPCPSEAWHFTCD